MAKKKSKQKQHDAEIQVPSAVARQEAGADPRPRMSRKDYEREIRVQHGELVAMQEWVKASAGEPHQRLAEDLEAVRHGPEVLQPLV